MNPAQEWTLPFKDFGKSRFLTGLRPVRNDIAKNGVRSKLESSRIEAHSSKLAAPAKGK
jgi:hypothetical protein